MKKYVFLVLMLCAAFGDSFAAVTADVSSDRQASGRGFILTLTADEDVSASPDLSVLNKNFKIYSTSVSRQNYIVNGKSSATTTWKIGLTALNAGELEIPAIKVGNDSSSPLKITVTDDVVTPADDKNAEELSEYKLQTEIVNPDNEYYVQQQINYNVILTDNGSIVNGAPQFADNNSDWIIKSLGNPQINTIKSASAQPLRQITFKYALFPQKSGDLSLPDIWFSGYAQGKGSSLSELLNQDIFSLAVNTPSLFGLEIPVNLKADMQNIKILPVPSDYSGAWWLPAKKVEIKAEWIGENRKFKVGEAVSRLITLQASGVTENQLPEISFKPVKGVKQYPERPLRQGEIIGNMPVAEQSVVNVYVPETSGKIVLPEISVDWYNTETKRFEKAVVPSEEIEVMAAKVDNEMTNIVQTPSKAPAVNTESLPTKADNNIYGYLTAAFLGGLILGFILFKTLFKKNIVHNMPQCGVRASSAFLIKKAYASDFRGLRDGLILWATEFYPEKAINNLQDIATASGDENFRNIMNVIVAKLYNPNDESLWNPKDFEVALKRVIKQKKHRRREDNTLPPLYE